MPEELNCTEIQPEAVMGERMIQTQGMEIKILKKIWQGVFFRVVLKV